MQFTITAAEAGTSMSYEQIVRRAGHKPFSVLTIVYCAKRGDDVRRQGEVTPGHFLTVDEGMTITVSDTSNA